ncbi:MAG TPA: DNA repair exonuclease [Coriobacteriia bacterium]|jgi:DNA repair exonuclease SbcCD nuclease subunit
MSRTVRFVHAADLHLGAPFKGVDAADARVREALVASTHEALDRIVGLCLSEQADFLVLAGDVYNAAEKSVHDQAAFRSAMRRLAEAGVRAYVAHGNHDPADGWSAGLQLPDTVHVFSGAEVERVEHVRDGETVAVLYGRSFPTRKVTDRWVRDYERRADDPLAIGVLHTNVGGRAGYDDYAPASADELGGAGMDYWALGHIHMPGRVLDDPLAVYAGCPQGLQPNEDGPRGCYVVEAGAHGVEERFVETASVRWARSAVDVADVGGIDELMSALGDVCDAARAEAAGRPAILRLDVSGRSAVHAELARPGVLDGVLKTMREEQLDRDPWIWVDDLRDRTRRELEADASRTRDGFDGELVRLADGKRGAPAEAELERVLGAVTARLAARPDLDLDADAVLERARDLALDLLLPEADR